MGLPVIQPQPPLRRSRSGRWRASVLLLVHLLIAAHIVHWLVAGSTITPVEPSEATALARSGVVNAGLIFFAATILLTAVFGRFFCGWGCHVLALQDASAWLLGKLGRRPKPLRSRLLRFVPLAAAIYVFIWPLAYRIWLDRGLPRVGFELQTSEFWATFPGWVIGALTFLVCGFVIVYFLGTKGFCTYACPYGAFFAAADRIAPMRIRVTDACEGCGHCTATCSSNVRVHEEVRDFGMVVDDGCMKCLDCVSVCPNDALYYGAGPLPGKAARQARTWLRGRLERGEEIVLGAAFIAGFVTVRGLYGAVPLLMALGASAILAYFALLGYQLFARPNLKLKGLRLKRQGRLLAGGWAVTAALAMIAALWAHSAVVRYHTYLGAKAYRQSTSWHLPTFDLERPAPVARGDDRDRLSRGAAHLARAEALGLLATSGGQAQRAWLYQLSGQQVAMRAAAAQAIMRDELAGDMHLLLGRDAFDRGEIAAAIGHFDDATRADPFSLAAYRGLGSLLIRRQAFADAGDAFARGFEHLPQAADLAYNAAVAHAMSGRPLAAIDLLERSLAIAPTNLATRENLAGLLAQEGRFEEAAAHYRTAVASSSTDAETWTLYGRVLLALGRLDEAAIAARTARGLDSTLQEAVTLAHRIDELRLTQP